MLVRFVGGIGGVVRVAMEGYEARLREIEAAVMRAASEREEAAALRLLTALDGLRTDG